MPSCYRKQHWSMAGIALAPELGKGYSSNGRDATVTVFDLRTLRQLSREGALDLLGQAFEKSAHIEFLNWAKSDPDLDAIREHPRFKAMLAVEARLAHACGRL